MEVYTHSWSDRKNALAFVSMPQYVIDAVNRIWKQEGIMRVMGSAHAGVA